MNSSLFISKHVISYHITSRRSLDFSMSASRIPLRTSRLRLHTQGHSKIPSRLETINATTSYWSELSAIPAVQSRDAPSSHDTAYRVNQRESENTAISNAPRTSETVPSYMDVVDSHASKFSKATGSQIRSCRIPPIL